MVSPTMYEKEKGKEGEKVVGGRKRERKRGEKREKIKGTKVVGAADTDTHVQCNGIYIIPYMRR